MILPIGARNVICPSVMKKILWTIKIIPNSEGMDPVGNSYYNYLFEEDYID
jgi:hypothetical protein